MNSPWRILLGSTLFVSYACKPIQPLADLQSDDKSSLPVYPVHHTSGPIVINGNLDEKSWQEAPSLDMHHPWPGQRDATPETTNIKLLWDTDNIYMGVRADDKFMEAQEKKTDGAVFLDDCAEIFLTPMASDLSRYLGFEVNIQGVMLDYLASQAGHGKTRKFDNHWNSAGVEIKVQPLPRSTINNNSDTDAGWTMELKIPAANFQVLLPSNSGKPRIEAGKPWRGNVFRCEGRSHGQFAIWSPTRTTKPDFHFSEFFGTLNFSP